MIEVEILKDVKGYEPKLFGPFTVRQSVCLALAAVVVAPVAWQLSKIFVSQAVIVIGGVLAAPFIVCGFKKIYGMPAEVFAMQYIKMQIMCPATRKYKTQNYYENYIPANECKITDKELKLYKKKNKKLYKQMRHSHEMFK